MNTSKAPDKFGFEKLLLELMPRETVKKRREIFKEFIQAGIKGSHATVVAANTGTMDNAAPVTIEEIEAEWQRWENKKFSSEDLTPNKMGNETWEEFHRRRFGRDKRPGAWNLQQQEGEKLDAFVERVYEPEVKFSIRDQFDSWRDCCTRLMRRASGSKGGKSTAINAGQK